MKKKRKKYKYNRHIDLRYKIIMGMAIIVLGIVLLSFSFNSKYLYVEKFLNSLFYYPFSNLKNDKDIIGKNINDELEKEIEDLKKLTKISQVLSEFEKVNAVVVSRDVSYWLDEIIINCGSKQGLKEGMAVVTNNGVVGYIKEVYETSSRVTLITNSTYNNTSVRIGDKYLVLEYDQNNDLIINQLDNTDTIKEKAVVYTSGLTDKFPAGLTIGYISKIEDNIYGNGKKLYVSLYYDINSLRYVSVLKRKIK